MHSIERNLYAWLLALGCVLALAACKAHRPAAGCVEGKVESCACPDKSAGIQICQDDNTFGACRCLIGVAGPPGTGGNAAGRAGTGASGSSNGTSGTGAAGRTTGASGTGGSTGGGAGRVGGAGQAGFFGGSGGSAIAGSGSTVPPYSACSTPLSCGTALTCTFNMTTANGVGYCSPSCGPIRPCPQPTSGGVRSSCSAGVCVLGSCERAACPDGMMCVQSGSRSGMTNGFSCAYPTK